jgi:hypothetical protein
MELLTTCEDLICLDDLAARIRASSNFRFAWQFFQSHGMDLESPTELRRAFDAILASPSLHEFLRNSFVPMYHEAFTISPLHEHCRVGLTEEFENILARAANDHLGAYSRDLRDATFAEKAEINELFSRLDRYRPFQLLPGNVPGCMACTYSHIFSTWFYSVAWDWCLMAAWPSWGVLWMACLTDTD